MTASDRSPPRPGAILELRDGSRAVLCEIRPGFGSSAWRFLVRRVAVVRPRLSDHHPDPAPSTDAPAEVASAEVARVIAPPPELMPGQLVEHDSDLVEILRVDAEHVIYRDARRPGGMRSRQARGDFTAFAPELLAAAVAEAEEAAP